MCITVASYSKATAKVLIFSATEAISHILLIYINNLSLSLCLSLPLCLSPFDFLSPVSHIVICRIAVWDRMQVAGASGMRIVVWDRMQVAGVFGMRIAVWDRMQVAGVSGMSSLWYISWSPFPFSPYIARLPWRPDDGVGQYVRVKSMSWTASLAPAMRREACARLPLLYHQAYHRWGQQGCEYAIQCQSETGVCPDKLVTVHCSRGAQGV